MAAVTPPEDSDRAYPAAILEVTGSAAEEPSAETVATTPAGALDPTFEVTFDSADQASIYQEGLRCPGSSPLLLFLKS